MRQRAAVLSGVALLVTLALASSPTEAQFNPCDPANCPVGCNQIFGTAGNDVITGTAGCDCIYGFGGNDCLYGGSGDDILCGGDGIDLLRGDGGADKSYGEAGNDQLCTETQDGGAGTDWCQLPVTLDDFNCENWRTGCPKCADLLGTEP